MKKILYRLILLLPIILFCGCSNDDDSASQNPINQLPEATQTGENTFGCLLDGEAFIPGGGTNPLDCVYQLINGDRFFNLQGNKRDANFNLLSISLTSFARKLEAGEKYQLLEESTGNVNAKYGINGNFYFTSEQYSGELTITHLDLTNQTISGTFFFDIIDQNGDLREIREGRFDMEFTQ